MSIGGIAACVAVGGWALALSVVDIRQRRLPNLLTVPGAAVILAGACVSGHGPGALLGGALLGALYLIVHLGHPASLGAGDVKLALGLGALTGAFGSAAWGLAAFGAPMFTALAGAVSAAREARIPGRLPVGVDGTAGPVAVPHGPSMCLASLGAVAVVVGLAGGVPV